MGSSGLPLSYKYAGRAETVHTVPRPAANPGYLRANQVAKATIDIST